MKKKTSKIAFKLVEPTKKYRDSTQRDAVFIIVSALRHAAVDSNYAPWSTETLLLASMAYANLFDVENSVDDPLKYN